MDNNQISDPVGKAVQDLLDANACKSSAEAVKIYDSWSDYDEAMTTVSYTGCKVAGDAVAKYLSENKDVCVLDVAAGTGLLGEELKAHGFDNVDALDASEGMLNLARQKNAYKNFIQEFFPCENTSLKTSSYDVVVSSAAISEICGMPTSCLPEMVRCVKNGGLVIISTRYLPIEKSGFEPMMKQLETEGQWQMLERIVIPKFYLDYHGLLFVFKITKPEM